MIRVPVGPSKTFVAVQKLVGVLGKEQVVGDRRDLLGLAPRLLHLRQFAFERAPFLLFVQRHLQREARGFGHSADRSPWVDRDRPMSLHGPRCPA